MQLIGKIRPWSCMSQHGRSHFSTTHKEQIALERAFNKTGDFVRLQSSVAGEDAGSGSQQTISSGLDDRSRPFRVFSDQIRREQIVQTIPLQEVPGLDGRPRPFRIFADQVRQAQITQESQPGSQNIQQQILAARVQLNGPDPYENGAGRYPSAQESLNESHWQAHMPVYGDANM